MQLLFIALILIALIFIIVGFERPNRSIDEIVKINKRKYVVYKPIPSKELDSKIEEDVEFLSSHAKAVIEENEGIDVLNNRK